MGMGNKWIGNPTSPDSSLKNEEVAWYWDVS